MLSFTKHIILILLFIRISHYTYTQHIAYAGVDLSICELDTTSLNAIIYPDTLCDVFSKWHLINGSLTISNDTDANSPVHTIAYGEHIVEWLVWSTTCDTARDTLIIWRYKQPFANTGADLSICNANIVTLTGNNPQATVQSSATGYWTQISGPTSYIYVPDHGITNADSLEGGYDYRFVWEVSNGNCVTAYDTLSIENIMVTDANLLSTDTTICASDTLLVLGNTPLSHESIVWFSYGGADFIYGDTTTFVYLTGFIPGENLIIYQFKDGFCLGIPDTVTVLNNQISENLYESDSFLLCSGDSITLTQILPTVGVGNWQLSDSTVLHSDLYSFQLLLGPLDTSNFLSAYSIQHGPCSSDTAVYLIDVIQPELDAGADIQLPCTDTILIRQVLSPFESSAAFVVNPSLTTTDTSANAFIINSNDTGIFIFEYANAYGCYVSDSLYISACKQKSTDTSALVFHNAFTPNGDGINDTYLPIVADDYLLNSFSIYNRWGEKVYEGLRGLPWDGTHNGKKCNTGVYVIQIELLHEQKSSLYNRRLVLLR